jgi:hypothetical protein
MPRRETKKKKEIEGDGPTATLTITANIQTGETNVEHPTNLLLALRLLHAAESVVLDAMSENQASAAQIMREKAEHPPIEVATAGALRALPPHAGNGRG